MPEIGRKAGHPGINIAALAMPAEDRLHYEAVPQIMESRPLTFDPGLTKQRRECVMDVVVDEP